MDRFWDVVETVCEIVALLIFAVAVFMIGSMAQGVHP